MITEGAIRQLLPGNTLVAECRDRREMDETYRKAVELRMAEGLVLEIVRDALRGVVMVSAPSPWRGDEAPCTGQRRYERSRLTPERPDVGDRWSGDLRQAAQKLGLSEYKVRKLAESGELRCHVSATTGRVSITGKAIKEYWNRQNPHVA